MKSPFSPWLPYGVMIAVCIAFAAYVMAGRHVGWRLGFAEKPAGIVRSIWNEPAGAVAKTHATVELLDGSVVDGEVAPGCLVQIGDRVIVRDIAVGSVQKYLVFPETPVPTKELR